ncbi:MAG: hypothetical protein ACPGSD_11350 [Flavobacteriales bacterium]
MKNRNQHIAIFSRFIGLSFLLGFLLTSCTEIFEGDLDDDTFIVITPNADLETTNTQIQFLWQELEDATSYNLQIVSPNFSNITSVELDSNIIGKSFKLTLSPGEYEWKLKAQNAITESNTVKGKIFVDSTTDLSGATVVLLSPNDNALLNQTQQTLNWEPMYNADLYDFELNHLDTNINKPELTDPFIDIDFAFDGKYTWKVTGKNTSSSTESQTSIRTFIIDTYAPDLPSQFDPVDSVTIPLTQGGDSLVTLQWKAEINHSSEAPIVDRIQVSSSNAFQNSNLIVNQTLENNSSVDRLIKVKITEAGMYYWRVKSSDKAENDSGYATSQRFIVNFVL